MCRIKVVPVDQRWTLGLIFVLYFRKLLISLSRSPFVYDYVRIPLEMWKYVGPEEVVTKNCLTLNTISEYFLQDCDILQNVVSRYAT